MLNTVPHDREEDWGEDSRRMAQAPSPPLPGCGRGSPLHASPGVR